MVAYDGPELERWRRQAQAALDLAAAHADAVALVDAVDAMAARLRASDTSAPEHG